MNTCRAQRKISVLGLPRKNTDSRRYVDSVSEASIWGITGATTKALSQSGDAGSYSERGSPQALLHIQRGGEAVQAQESNSPDAAS